MSDAVHLIVRGRVQGVFYRATTEKTAQGLGLTGWVRNCPDGSVEIHAEGEKASLEELIAWCWKGPALASVLEIESNWVAVEGHTSFAVR